MKIEQTAIQKKMPSSIFPRHWMKVALWITIGGMTLSVVLYSEVPLLRQAKERAYLGTIPLLIGPHIVGGILALLSGPLQFSSRLRRRHLQFHRVLGRLYVISVFISAPLAIVLSNHRHDPRAIHFVVATSCQASTWIITTLAAFVTARNGHIQQHKEWMVRSYAMTLTFVGTRVLQPLPAWNRHSEAGFAMEIIMITFLAILVPDIAFHWRQLTMRRVHSATAISHTTGLARKSSLTGASAPVSQIEVGRI